MEVAHHYRKSHSEFLTWDKADRDKAIWMHIREQETCSGCGTRAEEWDPEQGGSRGAYQAVHTQCPGCAALESRKKWVQGEYGDKVPGGIKIRLRSPPPTE